MKKTRTHFNRPLWILIALFLVFALPLFIAWLMASKEDTLGLGTSQHGILIQPPLDLTKLDLKDSKGQLIHPKTWLLLYTVPDICELDCEKTLYYLRQIRTATGKDRERVQSAVMTFSDRKPDPHLEQILHSEYPGMVHFTITSKVFEAFIHQAPLGKFALQQSYIYLVDPLGNILMVYTQKTKPMDIYKDLTKLLKISHIG